MTVSCITALYIEVCFDMVVTFCLLYFDLDFIFIFIDLALTSDLLILSRPLTSPRPLIYWPYVNLWSIDLAINSISDTLILPRPLMCCHIDLWPSAPDLTFNSGVDLTSTSDPFTLTLSRPLYHWPWPYPDLWLCPNLYISSVTFTLPRLYLELWSADHDLT